MRQNWVETKKAENKLSYTIWWIWLSHMNKKSLEASRFVEIIEFPLKVRMFLNWKVSLTISINHRNQTFVSHNKKLFIVVIDFSFLSDQPRRYTKWKFNGQFLTYSSSRFNFLPIFLISNGYQQTKTVGKNALKNCSTFLKGILTW